MENSTFLLSITFRDTSNTLLKTKVLYPADPPHEKEGIKFLGKPGPNTLHETPTTVPVLNIVFIPHLE